MAADLFAVDRDRSQVSSHGEVSFARPQTLALHLLGETQHRHAILRRGVRGQLGDRRSQSQAFAFRNVNMFSDDGSFIKTCVVLSC